MRRRCPNGTTADPVLEQLDKLPVLHDPVSLGWPQDGFVEAALLLDESAARRDRTDRLPAVTRDKVTMAVGVGRDKATGALRVVAGTSERTGTLRRAVREAVESQGVSIAGVPGRLHAERRVLEFMKREGLEPVTVGAGRDICHRCAEAIAREGATAASRLRTSPAPRRAPIGPRS